MAFYDFLNVIFAPLLKLPDTFAVIILAFLVSLIITVVTKYVTDQQLMKRMKEESKELQKQFKEARSNPQKLVELQKKQSEMMIQQFKHSFKPTLITIIPLLLIFTWMSSIFAYESINPQQEFDVYAAFDKSAGGEAEIIVPEGLTIVSSKKSEIKQGLIGRKGYDKLAGWTLKGEEGEHLVEVNYNGEKQQHSVLITSQDKYIEPEKTFKGNIKLIHIGYEKNILIPIGFRDWFGWLGTYIWSSLIFAMALRKLMKVY